MQAGGGSDQCGFVLGEGWGGVLRVRTCEKRRCAHLCELLAWHEADATYYRAIRCGEGAARCMTMIATQAISTKSITSMRMAPRRDRHVAEPWRSSVLRRACARLAVVRIVDDGHLLAPPGGHRSVFGALALPAACACDLILNPDPNAPDYVPNQARSMRSESRFDSFASAALTAGWFFAPSDADCRALQGRLAGRITTACDESDQWELKATRSAI